MKKIGLLSLALFVLLCAVSVFGEDPPKVVNVTPANGAIDVPIDIGKIEIVFDRNMKMATYSVLEMDTMPFPPMEKNENSWQDPFTFVLNIKELKPLTTYGFCLNTEEKKGLVAAEDGVPLSPITISFTTRAKSEDSLVEEGQEHGTTDSIPSSPPSSTETTDATPAPTDSPDPIPQDAPDPPPSPKMGASSPPSEGIDETDLLSGKWYIQEVLEDSNDPVAPKAGNIFTGVKLYTILKKGLIRITNLDGSGLMQFRYSRDALNFTISGSNSRLTYNQDGTLDENLETWSAKTSSRYKKDQETVEYFRSYSSTGSRKPFPGMEE